MYSARIVIYDGKDILDVLEIDRDVKDAVEMVKVAQAYSVHHMKLLYPEMTEYRVTYENIQRR